MTSIDAALSIDGLFSIDGLPFGRPGGTLVTTLIQSLVGATIENTPRFVDIKAWRGDDLTLPMTFMDDAREVTDGVTTSGLAPIVSPSAPWVSGDVNSAIVGDRIPYGSTIASFQNASQVTLSANATGSKQFARFRWGTPSDESAATFSAQVRAHSDSSKIEAEFSIDASSSADGLVIATLPTGSMAALRAGRHHWDFQRVLGGIRRTLLAGAFIVEGDTTRP